MNNDRLPGCPAITHTSQRPIAIYMPAFADGGAEKAMFRLAGAFAEQGLTVDFVVDRDSGRNRPALPPTARVVVLDRQSKTAARFALLRACPRDAVSLLKPLLIGRKPPLTLRRLPALAQYVAESKPRVLIALLAYAPILAVWATRIARTDTAVIVSERNHFSSRFELAGHNKDACREVRILKRSMRHTYPRAAARVAVSTGVADDLAEQVRIERTSIDVLYNPVVSPKIDALSSLVPEHPWFLSDHAHPVILAVGRLVQAKDFGTLIRAFARVRAQSPICLVILGDGPERDALQTLVHELGLSNCVDLPGWTANPYALMSRCAVFVSSSRREGLSNVLIEAMYCAAPIVATDCPSGTREILCDGQYGRLIPMQDDACMAEAIVASLDTPAEHRPDVRGRAEAFSVASGAAAWRRLIARVSGV